MLENSENTLECRGADVGLLIVPLFYFAAGRITSWKYNVLNPVDYSLCLTME